MMQSNEQGNGREMISFDSHTLTESESNHGIHKVDGHDFQWIDDLIATREQIKIYERRDNSSDKYFVNVMALGI
jgi:hypothetical protein